MLGICYLNGTGVAQDVEEAVQWFHKAAEQGHEEAIEWLQGTGMPQEIVPPQGIELSQETEEESESE